MSILLPSTPVAGPPEGPGDRAARLEMLIARLAAQQVSGQIAYWAAFADERGVSHHALTTDPAYADLSPENAARRTGAVAAFSRALERYRIARSSGDAAGTTLALASPRNAPPVPEVHVRAPEKVLSAAPSEAPAGVPVCPFLGLRNDPSTRYDFPDPGNSCRAAGARRPQPIGVEHQESRCLTAAHELCARHLAVEMVAANR